MSSSEEGTWYELRPNGHPSVAVWNPKRYRDRADADREAERMRARSPDYRFVEVVRYEVSRGERSRPIPVARI